MLPTSDYSRNEKPHLNLEFTQRSKSATAVSPPMRARLRPPKTVKGLNMNLLLRFKQMNSSSPRLSNRLPISPGRPLLELMPSMQAVRVVTDIKIKKNRASSPIVSPSDLTPLNHVNDYQLVHAYETVLRSLPTKAQQDKMKNAHRKYVIWSRSKQPNNNVTDVPRASDKIIGMELLIENRYLKREKKIQALKALKIPLTDAELRKLFVEISHNKALLTDRKSIKHPASFKVNCKALHCFLEVHNRKKMLIRFLDHTDKEKCIAQGAFKTVYLAWCITQPKLLAWAISKLDHSPRSVRAAAANEEKYLTLFNHQNNFVKLLDAFYYQDDQQVLVMKYYRQTMLGILNDHLTIEGPSKKKFTDLEKIDFALDLFETIQFIHANKVVHRDIKPDNILFSSKGMALTDFGYACQATDVEELKKPVGSFHYSPYEILSKRFASKGYGHDIWGAACVLWLLFSEKKYPWYDALNDAYNANDDVIRKQKMDVSLKQILEFHHEVPNKQKTVTRLFWEMFHPLPDSRPKIDEILNILFNLRELIKETDSQILPQFFSRYYSPTPLISSGTTPKRTSTRSTQSQIPISPGQHNEKPVEKLRDKSQKKEKGEKTPKDSIRSIFGFVVK